jgi:nucleoside-diphosphate-sugar epimerase
MRVFVTGATGFIGRHLCSRLEQRGDRVVALLRTARKGSVLPKNTELIAGDLSIFVDPATILPPCDVVVHLAGAVTAPRLEDYERINCAAVADLLACLERQSWRPKRFLFASSLAAAGPSPPERAWTEDDPPRPVDPYGAAKARAEIVVRQAPFVTTIFRPPLVFGPEDEASLTLFRAAQSGLGIRVAGPLQRLSFVDVRDLVEGILGMVDDARSGSFTYFTGHARPTDIEELWRELGRAVGKRVRVVPVPRWLIYGAMRVSTVASPVLRYRNQLDSKQYQQMTAPGFVCSSDALYRDLGWRAKYELAECLDNACAGYRAAGALSPMAAGIEGPMTHR